MFIHHPLFYLSLYIIHSYILLCLSLLLLLLLPRYRREKDGKSPHERLPPPPAPSLPIPTDKTLIPAYRAEAVGIFESSLPCCGLNTKFPVSVRVLRKYESQLFGEGGGFGKEEKTLLSQDKV